MKKILSFIIVMAVVLPMFISEHAYAAPALSAGAVSLIDAESGAELYGSSSAKEMNVASTTKIMTALVVLENCSPDDVVEVPEEAVGVEGSSIYLAEGEKITVKELLYGMMLESGNDAAVALAIYTAGSVSGFASLMNAKCSSLGLKHTHFANPDGLDEAGHYSCAADMAHIMAAAMKNDEFREITGTKEIAFKNRVFTNHNKLLWNCEGVIGGKTGYTMSSGRSLVSCCERGGMMLICVTLNDGDDWDDHENLYDWAFSEYKKADICRYDQEYAKIQVVSGTMDSVPVVCGKGVSLLLKSSDEYTVTAELPGFVYAGVAEGGKAGTLTYYVNGEKLGSVDLVYSETVPVDESIRLTFWEKFQRGWISAVKYGISKLGVYNVS